MCQGWPFCRSGNQTPVYPGDFEIRDNSVGALFAEVECIRSRPPRERLVSFSGYQNIVVETSDQSVVSVRSNYELWRSWVFGGNASEDTVCRS